VCVCECVGACMCVAAVLGARATKDGRGVPGEVARNRHTLRGESHSKNFPL